MNKKRICSFLFAILFCVGCCCMPASAKSLGYWWDKTTVYFICDYTITDTGYTSAVSNAMSRWNNIKTTTGKSMVTMKLTQNSSLTNNYITFAESFREWVGYCDPNPTTGELDAVTIKLSWNYNWSTSLNSNAMDVQTVVQHELGHALGIAHCHEKEEGPGPCWSATCKSNVMYPIIDEGDRRTTLTSYDISSYRSIYQY